MELIFPEYYREFSCIAAACPDSCCKEWEVDIDPLSAARYRQLPGALGARLRQVLRDTENGTVMTIEDGRCPMWRRDGLCALQAQLGHDALCDVCREFPRLRHDYGSFAELGLELSCPEAARLILTSPAQTLRSEYVPGGEAPEYDPEAMAILRRTREAALDLLADERRSVPQALAVFLLYAHAVQNELDGGAPAAIPAQIPHVDVPGDIEAIFSFFADLELLTSQWQALLAHGPSPAPWSFRHRNLARCFVLRYWLQAVSDYDLVSRAKLTVTACLLIQGLGGDTVQTTQLFSKEIENDPDNVEALLDGAYTSPALTDANLLALLQNCSNP